MKCLKLNFKIQNSGKSQIFRRLAAFFLTRAHNRLETICDTKEVMSRNPGVPSTWTVAPRGLFEAPEVMYHSVGDPSAWTVAPRRLFEAPEVMPYSA
ncbi:hypothetical protein NDU88_000085 [Pleurodeles waltl]|uniref:Uncharacterized protein n=1 Tax=Pleurodeles waltl TaxID=8319 RepID=A0AAV7LTK3_PLEWA|nr:hypothetical protein NDU88_000085 [Pleurodeles waltl]